MNVTVYLGANYGTDPTLQTTVAELGQWIGKNGHTLVYGGSASGLMGVLARSVMAAGGPVIGVEPQFFIDEGYELDGLTQLIVTQDMTERKAKKTKTGQYVTSEEVLESLRGKHEIVGKILERNRSNKLYPRRRSQPSGA